MVICDIIFYDQLDSADFNSPLLSLYRPLMAEPYTQESSIFHGTVFAVANMHAHNLLLIVR